MRWGHRAIQEVQATTHAQSQYKRPDGAVLTHLSLEGQQLEEYMHIAEKIGFDSIALLNARLLAWFKKHQVPLYHFEKVEQYLIQNKPYGKELYWVPLRKIDINPQGNSWHWQRMSYTQAIPLNVLKMVAEIHSQFLEDVRFLVSDFQTPKCDPFLVVTPKITLWDSRYFIVCAAWDEPTFDSINAEVI